ncbi:MAG: hypothetical protein LBP89_00120, partial [Helicobacteraceae bacterium]|nr:hypothetical protein [Helicobacteraceae bacterium]
IDGCALSSKQGGPCISVVCVGGADTEHNVRGKGGTFLLRVDTCKTDKGYPLILKDPGQSTWRILAKRKDVYQSKAATFLRTSERKYAYHITPLRYISARLPLDENGKYLRQSGNRFLKPLRPERNFEISPYYYGKQGSIYNKDITFASRQAFLYVVTDDKEITEYKVVNKEDASQTASPRSALSTISPFDPRAGEVKYEDTATKELFQSILCEADKTYELIYSNLRLTSKNDFQKCFDFFKTNNVNYAKIQFSGKHFISKDKREKLLETRDAKESDAPCSSAEQIKQTEKSSILCAIAVMNDPIGEIESRYDDLAFEYNFAFAVNKPILDDLMERNLYAYSVAKLVTDMRISEADAQTYDNAITDLKRRYRTLASFILNNLSQELLATLTRETNYDIEPLIDEELAKIYLDDVKSIVSFSDGARMIWSIVEYNALGFAMTSGATTYFYNNPQRYANTFDYPHRPYIRFKNNSMPSDDLLALLVFSVAYSPKYAKLRDDNPALRDLSDGFYWTLRTLKRMPRIDGRISAEINRALENQTLYNDFLERPHRRPLIEEYESLGAFIREVSFDYVAKTRRTFKTLKSRDNPKLSLDGIYPDYKEPKTISPMDIAEYIRTIYGYNDSKKAKTLPLLAYIDLASSYETNSETAYGYAEFWLNTLYPLIALRTDCDGEMQYLCLFDNDNALKCVKLFYKILKSLNDEDTERLMSLEIYPLFIEAIHAHTIYALMGTNDGANSKSKAEALLNEFNAKPQSGANVSDAIVAQRMARWLEIGLNALGGLSAFAEQFDDTADSLQDPQGARNYEAIARIRQSPLYRQILMSSRIFSFLIASRNIAEIFRGNQRLTTPPSVIGFINDSLLIIKSLENNLFVRKLPVNVPCSIEELVRLNKIANPTTLRIFVRFGVIAVLGDAIYNIYVITFRDEDRSADLLGNIAVLGTILALGMFGGPAGEVIALVVATAVGVFMFIRDITASRTPLEIALCQSLFFERHRTGEGFFTYAFARPMYPAETFKSFERSASIYPNAYKDSIRDRDVYYNGFDDLLTCVNLLYNNNREQYMQAMRTELTSLISVLRECDITICGGDLIAGTLRDKNWIFPVGYDSTLSISNSLASEQPKAYLRLYIENDESKEAIAEANNYEGAQGANNSPADKQSEGAQIAKDGAIGALQPLIAEEGYGLTLKPITLSESYDVIDAIIKANAERYKELFNGSYSAINASDNPVVSNALKHSAILIEVYGVTLKYDLEYKVKSKKVSFLNEWDRYYHIDLRECRLNADDQNDYDLIEKHKAEQKAKAEAEQKAKENKR